AARIDAGRQTGEQRAIVDAAREAGRQGARIDASENGGKSGVYHLRGKSCGGTLPERKDRREAGAGELALAIGADVFEKRIAERYVGYVRGARPLDQRAYRRLILRVRARMRDRHLPERRAARRRLPLEHRRRHRVHGDAIEGLVDGGHQTDDFAFTLLAQHVQRPGAVLAAAPGEERLGAAPAGKGSPSPRTRRNMKRLGPRMRNESMCSTRGSLRSRLGNSSRNASSATRASRRDSDAPRQK